MSQFYLTFLAVLFLATENFISAQSLPEEYSEGEKYAIIIAVSQHDNERLSLPLTSNDATVLANTLHQRGGFQIIPLYETKNAGIVKSARTVPVKKNIVIECQRVLQNCKAGDTVFLYFSGHGNADPNNPNKTYLLPKDADVLKLTETCLETAWLRSQLSQCKATTKFLILDACHAGGEKDADHQKNEISSHEIVDGEMEGVVTLASCTKNQRSYFWEEKEMSLFSYWLNEGLKSHGDLNGNGEITFNELDEYVNKNVTQTARELKNVNQTPIRIIRSDVSGVPVVLKPRAVSLDVILDDLAEQISAAMQINDIKRTGVLEFSTESGGRILDRSKYGTFAVYCAEKLEERIRYRLPRRNGFMIVAREAVEKSLREKGIEADDLFGNKISEAKIIFGDQPLESYVVGTIESQKGSEVKFCCNLVSVGNVEKLNTPRGTAILTESEWGMLGRSAVIPEKEPVNVVNAVPTPVVSGTVNVTSPADFLPPPRHPRPDYRPPVTEIIKPVRLERVSWIDGTVSPMPRPLSRNKNFEVEIEVKRSSGGYVHRPLIVLQNEMFVPFRRGEVYRIRLRNNDNRYIAVRVLVDGLNTLPQKRHSESATKFAAIAEADTDEMRIMEETETAPRVNLESARYWLLPPGTTNQIPGFLERVGSNAVGREFRVTDAPKALAAQKGFTEQIGIITVAYYLTKIANPKTRGTRSLGTEAGESFNTNVKVRNDLEIDQLLGIIQIRYAEENFTGGAELVPENPQQLQPIRRRR
jgi:hypothetical protein